MPTSLVAGGAGLIGSHLCERLIQEGHRVVCVDSFISSRPENLAALQNHPRFAVFELDVTRPLTGLGPLDFVYHLASPASPVHFRELSEEIAIVNSVGTTNLINLALESGAGFLLASTSEVYGDPLMHPQPETYRGNVDTIGERACYDEAKRFAETLTYIATAKRGLRSRIVRIFNTYGPRLPSTDGRAVVEFVLRSLRGEPIVVTGDGSQTRSWCFVSDMVEGIYSAMSNPAAEGQLMNLGNPEENTILDLAQRVREISKSTSQIVFAALPENDPARRCPDISRARKILGWMPRVPLDEGLALTIDWYRSRLDA